jgi:hypothetical protein
MNRTPKMRSQRNGGNRALAIQDRDAEHLDSTESLKILQARRLCSIIGCSEASGFTLASLAYGEGRS